MSNHSITLNGFSIRDIDEILTGSISLSKEVVDKVTVAREYLNEKMKSHKDPIYGINTGFGSLCDTKIENKDLGKLQENLIMSHACGMGDEVPNNIVKLMLLLKVQGLSFGHSGVDVDTIKLLVAFYNRDILPVVYQLGSLGASGDLSPLAHMCLPLLGMGEVWYKGEKRPAANVLSVEGLKPITLQSKEGLALLNGTQFMSAYGVASILKAERISQLADIIGAVSLEGYDGRIEPFNAKVHNVRPHMGQIATANAFRKLLEGSEIITRKKEHVQDPYSFRCMPQVHGASKDTLQHVYGIFETEINSVTDNPTVFPEQDEIISAGNFHGQPLALGLDFLAIAIAELGNISERRTYQLIGGKRGLPPFLVANPGLDSGFMIPQYTSASIVSQNKQLCTPASVDSIESSNGQEDHVSMGANAATKCYRVMENVERILSIELFNATQALEFRRPAKSSATIEGFVAAFREKVAFVEQDKIMFTEIHKATEFVKTVEL
ncbi:MAG: histidine ammonia-lyase [Flavobacteriales bacterium]|jgi:histidine ammonia-lyase